ncbi:MAG: amidoligase family protein [Oscillospiraceae bacterium]|nr:amidoligase family protein [Oscillospiraceae bacterium]
MEDNEKQQQQEVQEDQLICTCCGAVIEDDDYYYVGDDVLCPTCVDDECGHCDHCGELIYLHDAVSDDDVFLCQDCYDDHYNRCEDCGRIIHSEDTYYSDDYAYCLNCYEHKHSFIQDYHFKPSAIFYGKGKRFFGVELEVDHGGHDNDNAEELLDLVNHPSEKIYIKADGSLDDGFEIVTHPMSLAYHLNEFPWDRLTETAIHMGYRSHQTSTCGLHIHVSRNGLGESFEEQEEVISRILFFVEAHWNELLKFSRRSEYSMNRWAARHGYEHTPKEILDKAKSSSSRYVAVNLCNYHTIEFRLFRGTLKLNTILATLQLVNHICDTALYLTDQELQSLSWSEFVANVEEPELVQYLKERRLYVNDEITNEEET